MSYIKLSISDRHGAISGEVHGSMTDVFVATLTAEPETIAEFEKASARFIETESDWGLFRGFHRDEDLEPYDAGIVAIDLHARVIGYETTYSIPSKEGMVRVPNKFANDEDGDIYVPYHLPDDWTIIETIPLFEGTRIGAARRREACFPFDARPILYGRPLLTHIAQAVLSESDLARPDLSRDIHAGWLMGPRRDLRGKTPREIVLEKRSFISWDMDSRSHQWSFTKVCPPPLCKSSFAYEAAGFGTHEWVVYYEMIRHLIASCIERAENEVFDIEDEVHRLTNVRDEWLNDPDGDFSGRAPAWIIEQERLRINLTVSAKEALIDEDCPCCVGLSEIFDTPMFRHFDGCNMDEGFEFSNYQTREEWEEEQLRWEQFNREWKEREKGNPDELSFGSGDLIEDPF